MNPRSLHPEPLPLSALDNYCKRDAKNTRRCSITMLPGAPRVSFHPLPAHPVHPVPVHPSQHCPCQAVQLPQSIAPLRPLPQTQTPQSLEPRRLVARVGSLAPAAPGGAAAPAAAAAAAPAAVPAAAVPAVVPVPRSQAAPKSLLRRSTAAAAAAAEPCTALAPLAREATNAGCAAATGSRNCPNGARRRKSLPEPELLVVKLFRI